MWKYLDNDQWDAFVLKGIGRHSQRILKTGKDIKIFEVGSGTGAALATLVRLHPSVTEVYGLEPAHAPADVCMEYFEQDGFKGKLTGSGKHKGSTKIIPEYAGTHSMEGLEGDYYDLVISNGVLGYVQDR